MRFLGKTKQEKILGGIEERLRQMKKNMTTDDLKIKALSKMFKLGALDIEDARGRIQLAITNTKEYKKLDLDHQAHALEIINEELDREGKDKIGLVQIGKIAKRIENRLNVECPVPHGEAQNTDQASSR